MMDISADEWGTVVPYDSLWNFELTDDIVTDEISYSGSGGSSEGTALTYLV